MRPLSPAFPLLALSALLALPGTAWAQCSKDTDCKGDRICGPDGQCVDPGAAPAEPEPEPTIADAPAPAPAGRGWATAGGIVGLAAIVPTTALVAVSAANYYESDVAIPTGAAGTVVLGVVGPLTFSASRSGTQPGVADGVTGLRVGGWVAYGVAMANAVSLIAIGLADVEVAPAQIIATGVLGDLSLAMFSLDALVVGGRASRAQAAGTGERPALVLAPYVGPAVGPDGIDGGMAGLSGSF